MITNECLDEIKGGERPTMSEEVDVERRKAGAFARADDKQLYCLVSCMVVQNFLHRIAISWRMNGRSEENT